jgi:hypothetical protein
MATRVVATANKGLTALRQRINLAMGELDLRCLLFWCPVCVSTAPDDKVSTLCIIACL